MNLCSSSYPCLKSSRQQTAEQQQRTPLYACIHQLVMVEIFSGSGHLGKAFLALGYQVLLRDICLGPQYDLTKRKNVCCLMRIIGQAAVVHMGPPCSSFSIARRGSAPRSRQYPMGRPDLPPADVERVRIGNLCLLVAVRVVVACCLRGIPVTLENPTSSRMFICPCLVRVVKRFHAVMVHTVFCAYGTPWRKQTTFAVWNCPALSRLETKCNSKQGICEHSHKPHQILEGSNGHGSNWTKVAEPYPPRLCRKLARLVRSHHMRRASDVLRNISL